MMEEIILQLLIISLYLNVILAFVSIAILVVLIITIIKSNHIPADQ